MNKLIFALFMLCASAGSIFAGPLKVYILVGQSNMQGHAKVSTFDYMAQDPKTASILHEMRNRDGSPRVCRDVWISSIGCAKTEQLGQLGVGYGSGGSEPKIGPEYTFGLYMHKFVSEPILLIKTAWGGKSLHTDFRPPSAGEAGAYYRQMVEHVNKVLVDIPRVYPGYDHEEGYELAGFVWFQGWNDMVDRTVYPNRDKPGGYDMYSTLLAQFIRDVRKEFSAPDLPFVIGVLGVGGPVADYGPHKQRYSGIHDHFRKAMAAPAQRPEFKGQVTAVLTEKYWDARLEELNHRKGKISAKSKQLQKEKNLSPEQRKAQVDQYRAELFTSEEWSLLQTAVSNGDYHYLGAAKITAQIGKAFAEALNDLH